MTLEDNLYPLPPLEDSSARFVDDDEMALNIGYTGFVQVKYSEPLSTRILLNTNAHLKKNRKFALQEVCSQTLFVAIAFFVWSFLCGLSLDQFVVSPFDLAF